LLEQRTSPDSDTDNICCLLKKFFWNTQKNKPIVKIFEPA
jgi:hypothetical protein